MTDRELLEAAAKALGGEYRDHALGGAYLAFPPNWNGPMWRPLEDDGDALRLAVALRMEVTITPKGHTWADISSGAALAKEPHGSDPAAATRRAIVSAAAKMAKA